jgi:hypothetical protein
VTASKRYLKDLRRALPRGLRRRVVAELRQHLRDGIAAEIAGGLGHDEAERLTIERLGPPERVAAQFASDAPAPRGHVVLVAAVVVLAAIAIAAGAVVTHTQHAKKTPPASPATYAPPRVSTVASSLVVLVRQVAAKQLHTGTSGTPVVPRVIFVPSR